MVSHAAKALFVDPVNPVSIIEYKEQCLKLILSKEKLFLP